MNGPDTSEPTEVKVAISTGSMLGTITEIGFRGVRNDDVLRIVERLNNRPRKCLGFRTPNEAFFNLPVAFGLTI